MRPTEATEALAFARRNRRRFLAELREFVRIPSVSADPARSEDVRRCAQWLASHLRRIGVRDVALIDTAGHPAVVARAAAGPTQPTVLIYGHYDVQPAHLRNGWQSPPFTPTVREPNLHGRGATDDKGQLFAHIKALEAYLATSLRPPVNVAYCFDGEEEIGSPNLRRLLDEQRSRLAPDIAVMSDTRMLGPRRPAITYALRGSLGLELELRGPSSELHSGNFGGAVNNPIQALSEIIARLHDRAGRIAVPHLYDPVRSVSASERSYMRRNGPTDASIRHDAGIKAAWGEAGFTLYERTTIRPALIVNGIEGGYQGPGGKSIIPPTASAKLQLRLVPDQNPDDVAELLRRRLGQIVPPTVSSTLRFSAGTKPTVLPRHHPGMEAAARAYRGGFGANPAFVRSGGTIPAVSLIQELFGVPTVMMGFALPTSRIHAPNERLHLPTFDRAIDTCVYFLHEVRSRRAALRSGRPRARRRSVGGRKEQRRSGNSPSIGLAAPGHS